MPVLATLRTSLLLAFKSLPLLLIGFIAFLAFGLGVTSLFILLTGQAILVPALTELLHFLSSDSPNVALLTSNDISQLLPAGDSKTLPVNVFPSYWMAHMAFFFGYLLTNAVVMYTTPLDLNLVQGASSEAAKKSINEKLAARKGKAYMLILSTIGFFLLITFLRVIATGAETFAGILVATLVLGGAGAGWYFIAQSLGATTSDIFGIAMQMMTPDSAATKPKMCVYSPITATTR